MHSERQRPDNEDMVAQLQRNVAALRAQRWRALDIQATIVDGEDHARVFPRLITQGLMWALPRPASRNGG